MSEQTTQSLAQEAREENVFEASARSLSEFVVRAAVLPFVLPFSKPSQILRSSQTGNYRPLPSPFLLALVTGVVASGVTSALYGGVLMTRDRNASGAFFDAIAEYYAQADGIKAVLFALPYVASLWIVAGLVSILMARGMKSAEPIFAGLALCVAAIIELAGIAMLVCLMWPGLIKLSIEAWAGVIGIYTLILTVNLIRFVFALRKEANSSGVAAGLACVPIALSLLVLTGFSAYLVDSVQVQSYVNAKEKAGSADSDYRTKGLNAYSDKDYAASIAAYDKAIGEDPDEPMLFYERGKAFRMLNELPRAFVDFDQAVRLKPDYADALAARARILETSHAYDLALKDFDQLLQLKPVDPALYNSRCWVRALMGAELDKALADCDESLRLRPGSRATLDSRGLVQLRRADFAAAEADYDKALAAKADDPHALYGRGLARLRLGKTANGQADITAALAKDAKAAQDYASSGLTPVRGQARPQDGAAPPATASAPAEGLAPPSPSR